MNVLHFAYCFIHIWIVATLGLQWVMLLWTLSGCMFSFLLGVCLGIGLLSLMLTLSLTFQETAALLSKVAAPFYIPTSMYADWVSLHLGFPRAGAGVSCPPWWPGPGQAPHRGCRPQGSLTPRGLSYLKLFTVFPLLLSSRSSARSFQLSGKMPEELTRCQEAALFWKILLLGSARRQEPPVFDGGHSAAGWGR